MFAKNNNNLWFLQQKETNAKSEGIKMKTKSVIGALKTNIRSEGKVSLLKTFIKKTLKPYLLLKQCYRALEGGHLLLI